MSQSPSPKTSRSKDTSQSITRIFVGRLSTNTTDQQLKRVFETFGAIKTFNMKSTYAFIEFEEEKSAKEAIEKMNNQELNNHKILVEAAVPEGKRAQAKSDDICFKCGHKGHW